MKKRRNFLLVVAFILLTTSLLAGSKNSISQEVIEQNYIQGIQSENEGLKISSTYFLGEFKCTKAILPLVEILEEDSCNEAKLAAALALIKIGRPYCLYMVKKSNIFSDYEKLSEMVKQLYTCYLFGHDEFAIKDLSIAITKMQ